MIHSETHSMEHAHYMNLMAKQLCLHLQATKIIIHHHHHQEEEGDVVVEWAVAMQVEGDLVWQL